VRGFRRIREGSPLEGLRYPIGTHEHEPGRGEISRAYAHDKHGTISNRSPSQHEATGECQRA
jgi:hypothetical protein